MNSNDTVVETSLRRIQMCQVGFSIAYKGTNVPGMQQTNNTTMRTDRTIHEDDDRLRPEFTNILCSIVHLNYSCNKTAIRRHLKLILSFPPRRRKKKNQLHLN